MSRIKWSTEELEELKRLCEYDWDYEFPGYGSIAAHLNSSFHNNRTAASVKYQDSKNVKAQLKK